jgi:integrase
MKTSGISQTLVRRSKEAGIRPFRAHALRHAKVKRSRRLVGLEITSQLIDHSTLDMTRHYANIDEDELAEATIKTGIQYDLWK